MLHTRKCIGCPLKSDLWLGWVGLACETNHILKDLVVWTTNNDNSIHFCCQVISEQKTKQQPDGNAVIGSLFEPLSN